MSEYQFDKEEAAEIAEQIDVDDVTDDEGNFVREKVEKEVRRVTAEREPDPSHYEGVWMNNLLKVEMALGRGEE